MTNRGYDYMKKNQSVYVFSAAAVLFIQAGMLSGVGDENRKPGEKRKFVEQENSEKQEQNKPKVETERDRISQWPQCPVPGQSQSQGISTTSTRLQVLPLPSQPGSTSLAERALERCRSLRLEDLMPHSQSNSTLSQSLPSGRTTSLSSTLPQSSSHALLPEWPQNASSAPLQSQEPLITSTLSPKEVKQAVMEGVSTFLRVLPLLPQPESPSLAMRVLDIAQSLLSSDDPMSYFQSNSTLSSSSSGHTTSLSSAATVLTNGLPLDFSRSESLHRSISELLNSCRSVSFEAIEPAVMEDIRRITSRELSCKELILEDLGEDFIRDLRVGSILQRLFMLTTPYSPLARESVRIGAARISGICAQSPRSNFIYFILKYDIIREYFKKYPAVLNAVVRAGSVELLKFVLDLFPGAQERSALLLAENSRSQNVLHGAIFAPDVRIARTLIAAFPDQESLEAALGDVDDDGDTPLHTAASFNTEILYEYIATYSSSTGLYEALLSGNDLDGLSVLQSAIHDRNIGSVRLILSRLSQGMYDIRTARVAQAVLFDALTAVDYDGLNVLHHAIIAGPVFLREIVHAYGVILHAYPDALRENLAAVTVREQTLLQLFFENTDAPSLVYLRPIIHMYREAGVDIAHMIVAQDIDGDTALHSAARYCTIDILRELLNCLSRQQREQVLTVRNNAGMTVNDILEERRRDIAEDTVDDVLEQAVIEVAEERRQERERASVGIAPAALLLMTLLHSSSASNSK